MFIDLIIIILLVLISIGVAGINLRLSEKKNDKKDDGLYKVVRVKILRENGYVDGDGGFLLNDGRFTLRCGHENNYMVEPLSARMVATLFRDEK